MNAEISTQTPSAIELGGLTKSYPTFKLGPIDLTVPRGSIYGLIGPNGAGKSTMMDLMFGMGRSDAGTIRMLDLDAGRDEVAIKLRSAYAGPETSFRLWGSVGRAIRFVRGFYPKTWDDDYCEFLMKTFSIGADDNISSLSFGAKTRLGLAMALSHRPELLLLDEPTTGLDPVAKNALFAQLLELVKDEQRTVFLSSHQLADVERYADHLAIIHNGTILRAGPIDEVLEPFRIADFTLPEGRAPEPGRGLQILERQGNRVRALVDRDAGGLDTIADAGARDLAQSTLTLEELFISLLKK